MPIDEKTREAVLRRDCWTCQFCGFGGDPSYRRWLEVHHKVKEREGGSDELDNLMTLCEVCHKQLEGKPP